MFPLRNLFIDLILRVAFTSVRRPPVHASSSASLVKAAPSSSPVHPAAEDGGGVAGALLLPDESP